MKQNNYYYDAIMTIFSFSKNFITYTILISLFKTIFTSFIKLLALKYNELYFIPIKYLQVLKWKLNLTK
jgi:hypothetical protein